MGAIKMVVLAASYRVSCIRRGAITTRMLMVAGPHILQIRFSLRFLLRGTLHRFAPGIFEPTHMIATSNVGDLAPDAEFHPITFM